MRDFDAWLAGFRPSIADYKYGNYIQSYSITLVKPCNF